MKYLVVTDYPASIRFRGKDSFPSTLEQRLLEGLGGVTEVEKKTRDEKTGLYYPPNRSKPAAIVIGTKASPATLGHEIGHAFDTESDFSDKLVSSIIDRELIAWKWHFKNRIRDEGRVPRSEIKEAIRYLATYLDPDPSFRVKGESKIIKQKAEQLISEAIRSAKAELRKFGEP